MILKTIIFHHFSSGHDLASFSKRHPGFNPSFSIEPEFCCDRYRLLSLRECGLHKRVPENIGITPAVFCQSPSESARPALMGGFCNAKSGLKRAGGSCASLPILSENRYCSKILPRSSAAMIRRACRALYNPYPGGSSRDGDRGRDRLGFYGRRRVGRGDLEGPIYH